MLAVATFALGVAAGLWLAHRPQPGVNIDVVATNAIPRELERLGLTTAQRAPIQAALTRGRDRVLGVADAFQGRIESAADSTDQEIRALLSDSQRASFDSARRANGPQFRRKRVVEHR
jgi:hypothetical protein